MLNVQRGISPLFALPGITRRICAYLNTDRKQIQKPAAQDLVLQRAFEETRWFARDDQAPTRVYKNLGLYRFTEEQRRALADIELSKCRSNLVDIQQFIRHSLPKYQLADSADLMEKAIARLSDKQKDLIKFNYPKQ